MSIAKLYERLGIVGRIDPALYATAASAATASSGNGATSGEQPVLVCTSGATSDIVDARDLRRVAVIVQAATGASATMGIALQASPTTVASDFAQITGHIGTAIGSATAAATPGQHVLIEVSDTAIARANARYLRAVLTPTQGNNAAAGMCASVLVLADSRPYEPSAHIDDVAVKVVE